MGTASHHSRTDFIGAEQGAWRVVLGLSRGIAALGVLSTGCWVSDAAAQAAGVQGRGLGSAVLRTPLDRTDSDGLLVHLNVLQGSAARQLYERHGSTVEVQDPIGIYMVRLPAAGALGTSPGRSRTPTGQ
ncbi:GNAT family N-acetyltransferase [Streptomyces hygroscopicus]|uniref:GNAT family N-acetyltransferase n=1 Tax=Streptomyces hygroscopicus TaxID=1912 RepID=UPI001FCC073A|nr:GNAT family N-acetyltransferase [Streptomyces hygroscopicus]BDH14246.1 hypothetical protein HOK021_54250 [Streptomyces hygroscopicus]